MIMFRDLVTGDVFAPEVGVSVIYHGTQCPDHQYVQGGDCYPLADLSSLRVGEFYMVFNPVQHDPVWWATEVIDA